MPSESIYFWMFSQGLKHVPLDHVLAACRVHGKDVREKDVQNYWNGWYKSALYGGKRDTFAFPTEFKPAAREFFELGYEDYEMHPYLGMPEVEKRFVPCNAANKPMIKWSEGCMSEVDARLYPNSVYLGENLCGCKFVVFDCDGDHTDELDLETVDFMWKYAWVTHRLDKRKEIPEYDGHQGDTLHAGMPASFHLTFKVDRVIPTMHFQKCHIDIVGNKRNSLRYFKDKEWNGKEPMDMTPEIWEDFKSYIRRREES